MRVFSLTLIFILSAMFVCRVLYGVIPNCQAASTTTISIDPSTSLAGVGQTFVINVKVSDVIDLYGWEFRLRWNSTLLESLNVTEGTFLKGVGETFFVSKTNNTVGYMLVDCLLVGDVPGVSGNGILATVEFYAETRGECVLDLYGTKLASSLEQPITHTAIDGYYYTPPGHDVAVKSVTPSKTVVGKGYSLSVSVAVENQGSIEEEVTVTVYYDANKIGTQGVTLNAGSLRTLEFTWNTTGVPKGTYTINANVSVVPGETDVADNSYIDGVVTVTIAGDVDGDFDVDSSDLFTLAVAYGSEEGNPLYNPNCDGDGDGDVDSMDLFALAANYGKP